MTATPGGLADAWWAALAANQSRSSQHEVKVNLNRARALMRGGKVVGLQLTPGLVTAEVVDGQTYGVSVQTGTFEPRQWEKVTSALADDLQSVTALFEGTLPSAFVARLGGSGVQLVPASSDIEGSCDCPDHVYPCAHLAAVHLLVGQVIEADPLELFTLRGRGRDALLTALRRAWGGDEARAARRATPAVFADDPYASPVPLEGLRFDFRPVDEAPGAGLRALGPIPGDTELLKALAPMYEAGGRAALAVALGDSTVAPQVATPALLLADQAPHAAERSEPEEAPAPSPKVGKPRAPRAGSRKPIDVLMAPPPTGERPLTERIVEALADGEGALVGELIRRTRGSPMAVRRELAELEALGLVYCAGSSGASRWRLA